MAMIEVTDLVVPFRKWTHAVSLVAAIILFAAFRVAGGGITFSLPNGAGTGVEQPSSREARTSASFLDEDQESIGSNLKTGNSSSKGSSGFIEREDDFDPLSVPNGKKGEEEEEVIDAFSGAPADDGKKGGFADIERELGLR